MDVPECAGVKCYRYCSERCEHAEHGRLSPDAAYPSAWADVLPVVGVTANALAGREVNVASESWYGQLFVKTCDAGCVETDAAVYAERVRKTGDKNAGWRRRLVRPVKDESTGRPDKRSAIRLGNMC